MVSSEGANEPVTIVPGKLKNQPVPGAGLEEWLPTQPSQNPMMGPDGAGGDGDGDGDGGGAGDGGGVGDGGGGVGPGVGAGLGPNGCAPSAVMASEKPGASSVLQL